MMSESLPHGHLKRPRAELNRLFGAKIHAVGEERPEIDMRSIPGLSYHVVVGEAVREMYDGPGFCLHVCYLHGCSMILHEWKMVLN